VPPSALGLPIALGGTAGYIWNGLHADHLPAQAIGYVHLPALVVIVAASLLTTPMGARAAHRVPVATLKRIFSILLVALAARMLWKLWVAA